MEVDRNFERFFDTHHQPTDICNDTGGKDNGQPTSTETIRRGAVVNTKDEWI